MKRERKEKKRGSGEDVKRKKERKEGRKKERKTRKTNKQTRRVGGQTSKERPERSGEEAKYIDICHKAQIYSL